MKSGVVAVLAGRVPRLRIRDVEDVVVDADAARPAELPPFGDERAARREDLDAVVGAITHEDPSFGIERERVRVVELPRPAAGRAELLDERAVLREVHDASVRCRVDVAVSDP